MPVELRQLYPARVLDFSDSETTLEVVGSSTGTPLIVQDSTDNASNQVAIFRGGDRGTAADGDNAYISYTLEDSGGSQAEFARMAWTANDVTSNTKDSKVVWSVQTGNTLTDVWEISSSASGAVTTSFQTGEIVLPDNVSLQLGNSGADGDISSNGTDIKWIVPSTADVVLGRTGAPSPDTLLHLWAATAGSVVAATDTLLTLEHSGTALISILAPTQGGILFGDAADNNVGQITYTHSNNALGIIVGAASQLVWTDGVMAFQKAMTLSSTAAFTLNATGISGTAIKDEDNMATNSATHLASQQSIKAYVDAVPDTLAELTDVTITSVADNNFLQYDSGSSKWVNKTTPEINDSGADHQYIFAVGNLAANRIITLPVLTGGDTFVFEAHIQTLIDKTLTAPTINAGTLNLMTVLTVANNIDVGNYTVRANNFLADSHTAGRVFFAGTDGVLTTDSDLTFSTDTLTVTKIGAFAAAGAINFDNQNMTNVDIDSGDMTGVTISGALTWSAAQNLNNQALTNVNIDSGTVDGITSLTIANNIDVGAYEIRALKFESDQATGTAPFTVASTTLVTNLNADLLDGVQGANYATLTGAEILTSKTLTTPQINDSASDHQYVFAVANLADDRTVSLPLLTGNDTFTFNAFAAILTNKTIDSDDNTITNIVNVDIKASAGIVDTKLATIATGNKVSGSAVQLSGTSAIEDSSGLRIKAATAGTGLSLGSQVLSVDVAQTQITSVGALNGGSITSGFGTIDTGSSNITTSGTVAAGTLTVSGDLTVSGTTTTISSTVITVADPLIALASTNTANAVDMGIYGKYRTNGTDLYTGLFWDATDSKYKLFHGNQAAPTTTVNTSGTGYAASTLVVGTLEGTVGTAAQGSITSLGTLASLTVTGAGVFNGNVDLGNATSDTITATGRFDSDLVPSSDDARDLGTSDLEWQDLYLDGTANIDVLTADAGTVGGSDIVTLAATQTLLAKTLTAPTINAGTLNLMTVLTVANDIDVGAYEIRALKFESDQATGTAPLTVASTTVVTNLNSDLLDGVQGALYSQIVATETLSAKTLTQPKIVNNGYIADANGAEQIIFVTTGSAVNELTITNGSTGVPATIASSGESNIGLRISGSGTGGVILHGGATKGSYLEFGVKQTTVPDDPSTELARMYLKEIDANNNAIAVKIQKAGAVVEVEITSPRAVCAVCGSKDGAKDPTYDFARSVMVLDLWCGHSFEVPMQWSQINGD